jgi:hypothetical protein
MFKRHKPFDMKVERTEVINGRAGWLIRVSRNGSYYRIVCDAEAPDNFGPLLTGSKNQEASAKVSQKLRDGVIMAVSKAYKNIDSEIV